MLKATAILACSLLPVSVIMTETSMNKHLLQAAKSGSLERLETLLVKGLDVNASAYRRTVVMEAVWGEISKS